MSEKLEKAGAAVTDRPAGEPSAPAEQTGVATTTQQTGVVEKSKVPIQMGMAPKTIEEGWRLAQWIANSTMVPKQYRGMPGDVLIAIQYGMELGFPPMQALQSIAVINGRPSVWGDGFLALIIGSSAYREHDEYFLVDGERRDVLFPKDLQKDDTTAVSTFWRRDRQNPIVGYFSIAQAKKASLWGKEGPWQTYPDRMLKMRARGFAGRDGFSDILRGVKSTEELLDTPELDLPEIPKRPDTIQPRRASEARATTDPPAASSPATTPAPEPAPAPGNAAPAPADPNLFEMRGLLIVHTGFVKPRVGEPYYEITAKTTTNTERKFRTREEAVYKEAASFEGTTHRVVAYLHKAKEQNAEVFVLNGLTIYEGGGAAAENGALFTE